MKELIYGSKGYEAVAKEIYDTCGVVKTEDFDVKTSITKRINYLKKFLKESNRKCFVLGISGGVDSTAAGRLAQLACEELRSEGYEAKFVAMRLPAGVQLDEADAQDAIKFINADVTFTVNIGEAATNLSIQGANELKNLGIDITLGDEDFAKGNIKARLRMTSQYQIAALFQGLVLGSENSSENCMAYFTRWGDQSSDIEVLNDLNKRQVRLITKELGSPESLWNKVATGDLEELSPLKTDSEGLGFDYDYLDDFLEGKEIPKEIEIKLVNRYNQTRFKRDPIVQFKN